jgi:hypothetical protein
MTQVFLAKQRIIYSQPSIRTEDVIVPAHPAYWWRPRGGAITGVEILGGKPSDDLVQEAERYGWRYCQIDGRFYPI